MNYLRSNLLVDISESDGGFDYVSVNADAVVFDIRRQDEVAIAKFRDQSLG